VASSTAATGARRDLPPPFGRIVCGVDGSRSADLAVEQAICLAGPSTALVFVCVRESGGAGATRQSTISSDRADLALEAALKAARAAGIDAACEILSAHDPRGVLLDEASRSDLLVVASHGGTRAGGIVLGSVASAAAHRASVPVLVARRPPGEPFPQRVLVATDGSADAERAVELAARIAHMRGSDVRLLSVDPGPHGDPKQIAADAVRLAEELGVAPAVVRASGHPAERIIEMAAGEAVSLIAVGSRGLSGLRALGSISERVAHRAPCSVLIARHA
jgi:nucleotide-binding universal stress UspA family protein